MNMSLHWLGNVLVAVPNAYFSAVLGRFEREGVKKPVPSYQITTAPVPSVINSTSILFFFVFVPSS